MARAAVAYKPMSVKASEEAILLAVRQALQAKTTEELAASDVAIKELWQSPYALPGLLSLVQNPQLAREESTYLLLLLKEISIGVERMGLEAAKCLLGVVLVLFDQPNQPGSIRKTLREILSYCITERNGEEASVQHLLRQVVRDILVSRSATIDGLKKLSMSALESTLNFFYVYFSSENLSGGNEGFFLDFQLRVWDVLIDMVLDLSSDRFSDAQLSSPQVAVNVRGALDLLKLFAKTFRVVTNRYLSAERVLNNKKKYVKVSLSVCYQLSVLQVGSLGNIKTAFFRPLASPELSKLILQIRTNALLNFRFLYRTLHGLPRDDDDADDFRRQENNVRLLGNVLQTALQPRSLREVFEWVDEISSARLLTASLNFLKFTAEDTTFVEWMSSIKADLICRILLPLLVLTPHELGQAEDNPDDFIREILHRISHKRPESVAAEAANVLSTLCYQVDGSLTLTVTALLELVNFEVSGSSPASLPAVTTSASLFTSIFFTDQKPELRLVTALHTLCGLADDIKSRVDLKEQLISLVRNYFATLTQGPVLVKFAVAVFIHTFALDLFPPHSSPTSENTRIILTLFEWLIGQLQEGPLLSRMAAKALLGFLKHTKEFQFIFPLLFEKMVVAFNAVVGSTDNTHLFILMRSVFSKFGTQFLGFEVAFTTTLKAILGRVEKEMVGPAEEKEKRAVINQCFNLVRALSSLEEIMDRFAQHFENVIAPMVGVLEKGLVVFDEEFLELVVAFADIRHRIPDDPARIFAVLPLIQEHNEWRLTLLSNVLNRFFHLWKDGMTPERIRVVLDMVHNGLTRPPREPQHSWEVYAADCLVVLQLLVMHFGKTMDAGCRDQALAILQSLVDPRTAVLDRTLDFLTDKVIGLHLCLLIFFPDDWHPQFKTQEALLSWSRLLYTTLHHFQTPYDLKLLTLGAIRLLQLSARQAPGEAPETVIFTLSWLVPFLKLQQIHQMAITLLKIRETRNLFPYEVQVIADAKNLLVGFPNLQQHSRFSLHADKHSHFVDDEDEPAHDYLDRFAQEKYQAVQGIVSPLGKVDEYVQLRQVLKECTDPHAWNAIAARIDKSPAHTFLGQVTSQIEYIHPEHTPEDLLVIRRILKVAGAHN